MEDFISEGLTGEYIAEINRCRKFLHDNCLLDIVTVDGNGISPIFWMGNKN